MPTQVYTLTEDSTNNFHNTQYVNCGTLADGFATYVASIYAKSSNRNINIQVADNTHANGANLLINLQNGSTLLNSGFGNWPTWTSVSVTNVGDSWWQIQANVKPPNGATTPLTTNLTIDKNGDDTAYLGDGSSFFEAYDYTIIRDKIERIGLGGDLSDGFSPANFSTLATTTISVPPPFAVSDWYIQFYDPYSIEPGLSAAWMQYHTGFLAPATVTTVSNWLLPLSEPVRSKPDIRWRDNFITDWQQQSPSFLSNWYQALAEPVRYRFFHSSLQTTFITDWQWQSASFLPNWYQAFSEPVRYRQFHSSLQMPFTIDPKWTAPPAPFTVFWFNWLSEPVRFKPALQVSLQPVGAIDAKITPPAAVPAWFFNWLSEPVRSKPPLPQGSMPHFFEIVNFVSYVIGVTETGDTSSLIFGEFPVQNRARVAIRELPAETTNVTIKEIIRTRGYS